MRPIRIALLGISLALTAFVTAGCVVIVPVPVPVPADFSSLIPSGFNSTSDEGPAVPSGPPLASVASLPVDASGEGMIQGNPTGEAETREKWGSFELVLNPVPQGLPPRTTVHVGFDHSTKVYRYGREMGDPLTALNSEYGSFDADPSAAGTAKVRFRIKEGEIFAERLDLTDAFPDELEP